MTFASIDVGGALATKVVDTAYCYNPPYKSYKVDKQNNKVDNIINKVDI